MCRVDVCSQAITGYSDGQAEGFSKREPRVGDISMVFLALAGGAGEEEPSEEEAESAQRGDGTEPARAAEADAVEGAGKEGDTDDKTDSCGGDCASI